MNRSAMKNRIQKNLNQAAKQLRDLADRMEASSRRCEDAIEPEPADLADAVAEAINNLGWGNANVNSLIVNCIHALSIHLEEA